MGVVGWGKGIEGGLWVGERGLRGVLGWGKGIEGVCGWGWGSGG